MRNEYPYDVRKVCETCARTFHVTVWATDSKLAKERPIRVKRCPVCVDDGLKKVPV